MSEVWTQATICFENETIAERWATALEPARQEKWDEARQALAALGLRCVSAGDGAIQLSKLQRFGRRLELYFMELGIDSAELLQEWLALGATHLRASTDDSRTGHVTKLVRIGTAKAKEAEFDAALAAFDDDFAFMTALDKGKSAEIKRLLAKGVDPNLPVRPSAWPIHYAVLRNKKPIVKLLIAAGADLNVQSGTKRILSDGRRTPLHLAVNNDSAEVLGLLLKAGADTTLRNGAGQTPLYVALRTRSVACCRLLAEAGADPHTLDDSGRPALFNLSTHTGDPIPQFLEFAESLGVDLAQTLDNGENLRWSLGTLPDVVRFFEARGIGPSAPHDAYTGESARDLFMASWRHDVEQVRALLAQGVHPHTPFAYFEGHTPVPLLLEAAGHSHADVVAMMLDAGGDLNLLDADDVGLLHAAARDGSVEVIELLLQRGADPNAIRRNNTMFHRQIADDPMLMALDSHHWAAADVLLKYWRPNKARLEHAKILLESSIEVRGASADATRLLAVMDARIAQGEWVD